MITTLIFLVFINLMIVLFGLPVENLTAQLSWVGMNVIVIWSGILVPLIIKGPPNGYQASARLISVVFMIFQLIVLGLFMIIKPEDIRWFTVIEMVLIAIYALVFSKFVAANNKARNNGE